MNTETLEKYIKTLRVLLYEYRNACIDESAYSLALAKDLEEAENTLSLRKRVFYNYKSCKGIVDDFSDNKLDQCISDYSVERDRITKLKKAYEDDLHTLLSNIKKRPFGYSDHMEAFVEFKGIDKKDLSENLEKELWDEYEDFLIELPLAIGYLAMNKLHSGTLRTFRGDSTSLRCFGSMKINNGVCTEVSYKGMARPGSIDDWFNFYTLTRPGDIITKEQIDSILKLNGRNQLTSTFEVDL